MHNCGSLLKHKCPISAQKTYLGGSLYVFVFCFCLLIVSLAYLEIVLKPGLLGALTFNDSANKLTFFFLCWALYTTEILSHI